MYQTLRETLASLGGESKTEFLMQAKNGVKFKVNTIAEGQEVAEHYSKMEGNKR